MNTQLAACGLGLLLAACTGGAGPSEQPSHPSAPATSATLPPTLAPAPTLIAWPDGVVAYPVGSGDSPLPYLEYLPKGYGGETSKPLLVYLHGVDEEADGSEASLHAILTLGVPKLIADGRWPSERPFVVLMPQEPVAKSQRCDFGTEIAQFLEFAVDRYEIDGSRIYLTGISCGGIGVWDYLAEHGDEVVAAAVPIAGHALWALQKSGCAPLATVPVWAFHGAKDDIVPVADVEGQIDRIRACDGAESVETELTVYPDADHDSWSRTYDLSAGNDIYAWMLEHSNN